MYAIPVAIDQLQGIKKRREQFLKMGLALIGFGWGLTLVATFVACF